MTLPCGRCIECEKAVANEWRTRLTHELQFKKIGMFVTLTFDENSCPVSLNKVDVQRWLKRLRREIEPARITYFACGEYGSKGARPHYHALVFGYPLSQQLVAKTWRYGFSSVSAATPGRIAYICGYMSKSHVAPPGCVKPFRLMSKGLGFDFVRQNAARLLEDESLVDGQSDYPLPRGYCRKLDIHPQRPWKIDPAIKAIFDRHGDDVEAAQAEVKVYRKRINDKRKNEAEFKDIWLSAR